MRPATSQLRAVQAFGAVARLGSVVGAARELAVSPSAVSHPQMGIAIVDPRFIEAEVAAGQLVTPFGAPLSLETGYWLVWRPGRERFRPLGAFRRWLASEVAVKGLSASGVLR